VERFEGAGRFGIRSRGKTGPRFVRTADAQRDAAGFGGLEILA
jgi:hypothetical protein